MTRVFVLKTSNVRPATLSATTGHSLRFALAIRQLALCLTEKHNFISPNDDRKRGSSGNKQSQRHQAQRFRNLKHFGSDRVGTESEETCPADSPEKVGPRRFAPAARRKVTDLSLADTLTFLK